MFFTFSQNNSGGAFYEDHPTGVSKIVIIEAESADEANKRAEDIGLYFYGCDDGRDCSCCGDRWYPTSDRDGEKTPSIYGTPVSDMGTMPRAEIGAYEGYLHPASGPFRAVKC